MKVSTLLTIFSCFLIFNVRASGDLDSLMEEGKSYLIEEEWDEAINILSDALILADKYHELKKKAKIQNNIGVAHWKKGNYKEGLERYEEALETYIVIGNDSLTGQAQYNVGITLKALGNYELAVERFSLAFRLFEKTGQNEQMARVYDALGNIHKDLSNFPKAIFYHRSALAIYKQTEDYKGLSRAYHNLGQVYNDSGATDLAAKFLFKAKGIKEKYGWSTASNDSQIGEYYLRKGDLDSAEYFFKTSLETRQEESNRSKLAVAYWHLGDLYLAKGNPELAEEYLDKAYQLGDSLELNEVLIGVLTSQLRIERQKTPNSELIQKIDRLMYLRNEILGEKSRKDLASLEIEYEVQKKDQEIELKDNRIALQKAENEKLNERNKLHLVVLSFAVIFIIGVIGVYLRLRRSKAETESKNQQLEKKNELIDSLHRELSHRTKNYYQMFGGILQHDFRKSADPEVKKMIQNYLNRVEAMSQIQRYLLEEKEISHEVQLNLYLEELLANIDLVLNNKSPKVQVNRSFDIVSCDYDRALRLGLVMNEMICNSFEHGFDGIEAPVLDITLKKNSDRSIYLEISDNGVGLDEDLEGRLSSKGIDLMKMILSSVKGELRYRNTNPGTKVEVTILN